MAPSEIAKVLRENIGNVVTVTFGDGGVLPVLIMNVDDEGFVYDLVPKDERTEYWTSFDDVVEVQSLG